MSESEQALAGVTDHADYTEIDSEEYFSSVSGTYPLYELVRDGKAGGSRAEIHPTEDGESFVAFVSGGPVRTPPIKFHITPSTHIEESLAVLEQVGFEHLTTDPPDPNEDPFQAVFDTIKEMGREDAADAQAEDRETDGEREVFDGSYQCRICGTVRRIGTFAGAARPPKTVTTDCECGGERLFDGLAPGGEPVLHRWHVAFEDLDRQPCQLELIAPSKRDAWTQVESDHPDRTIEAIGPLAYRVTENAE